MMSMIFPMQNGTDMVTAEEMNKRPMAPSIKKRKMMASVTSSYKQASHKLYISNPLNPKIDQNQSSPKIQIHNH